MTLSRPSRRRRHGFTLIEVLLVLAILVIIGSVAVTNYFAIHAKAKVDQAKIQMQAFKTPLSIYAQSMSQFPTNDMGLIALLQPPTDSGGRILGSSWIESVPPDPWGGAYQYQYPSSHNQQMPDIWCVTPDGQVIGNWE